MTLCVKCGLPEEFCICKDAIEDFFPDCRLRKILCDMKKGDTTGFVYKRRHYTILRDE